MREFTLSNLDFALLVTTVVVFLVDGGFIKAYSLFRELDRGRTFSFVELKIAYDVGLCLRSDFLEDFLFTLNVKLVS